MTTTRTVLVTGGNRGIGRAVAERFSADGHRVAVTVRTGTGPAGTLSVTADVTDEASVDEAFADVEARLGPVEIVVANAGITRDAMVQRMDDEGFASVIDTNLTGAFRVARRASASMVSRRWGRIVFLSSVVGLSGGGGQANYAASKAGLVGLSRSLTLELAGRGVTSNVVAPGFVETDMTAAMPELRRREQLRRIPAGRYAQPEEVAAVVSWVSGEDAGYVSGAVIPVDGGLGMGH